MIVSEYIRKPKLAWQSNEQIDKQGQWQVKFYLNRLVAGFLPSLLTILVYFLALVVFHKLGSERANSFDELSSETCSFISFLSLLTLLISVALLLFTFHRTVPGGSSQPHVCFQIQFNGFESMIVWTVDASTCIVEWNSLHFIFFSISQVLASMWLTVDTFGSTTAKVIPWTFSTLGTWTSAQRCGPWLPMSWQT